jgi:peptidoglycan/xylan/chitin deacetylase (PgdA/CDA1 family)
MIGRLRTTIVLALALAVAAAASPAPRVLRLPTKLPDRTLRVPILTYHRIDFPNRSLPQITQRLTVDPGDFARQMSWLKSHGYHALKQRQLFSALVGGGRLPSKPVMITFDDGYRNVYGKASPVLARLRMNATAYVITDRISGPDPSFLTWGHLRRLESRGIEIGSHTVHHRALTGLTSSQARAELADSRRALERHLAHPVQWLAYPLGAVDARVVRLTRRAGYVLAMTTRSGSLQEGKAPLELRRYEVLDSTGVRGVARMVGG